ncbi:MAG: chemotaxis protein CheA, partial [Chloroflexota bacterium]
ALVTGAGQTPAPAAPAATATPGGLGWQELARAAEAVQRGQSVRTAEIVFSEDCPMPAVRAFQAIVALEQLGEVLGSQPTMDEIEREHVQGSVAVTFANAVPDEQVRAAIVAVGDIRAVTFKPVNIEGQAAAKPDAPASAVPAGDQKRPADVKSAPARTTTSHTVRVDVGLLDNLMNLVGELVIDRTRLAQILQQFESKSGNDDLTAEMSRTSVHIGRVSTDLQEEIMKARMLPVDNLFKKFPRMVRDLSIKAGKDIDFVMTGQETELDRSMIEEISDPLMHLLRNSVDHGIELPADRQAAGKPRKGRVVLSAAHEESHIIITVSDDGKGIDPEKIKAAAVRKGILTEEAARRLSEREAIDLIFAAGFSTNEKVSEVSGRGVGMDVVRTNIERLSGAIEIETAVGKGTTFRLKLPLTLAIIKALLVNVGENIYCIPLSSVTETLHSGRDQVSTVKTREVTVNRGQVLPLLRLRRLFGEPEAADEELVYIVVVTFGGEQVGLVVDSLVGEQEVVIKSLTKFIGDVPGMSGATILGDGRVGLIIDVPSLVKTAMAAAD